MTKQEKIEDKKNEKRKIFDWIINILLIILLIVGIYLFLSKLFGSSPTEFQLILWLFGFFGTAMIKLSSLIYNLNRELGEFKIKSFEAFNKVKIDINIIKNNVDYIKQEIGDIKKLFKTKIK